LPLVQADSEQIKQVFLNLLRNAVEAMESGGTIHLTTARGADSGEQGMVVVRVQDEGPGVPPPPYGSGSSNPSSPRRRRGRV